MGNDKFLDIKSLSDYSSLSVRTLRDYIADDTNPLPSYCVKRKILVKRSEFDSWIEKYRANNATISNMLDEIVHDIQSK